MAKFISINVGFITNSSSVVHHFPREVLDDPDVKAFMKIYEIEKGFIGSDMWHRGECDTFAVTKEQKLRIQNSLRNDGYGDYSGPGIQADNDEIVIVYGDEYCNLVHLLCELITKSQEKKGIQPDYGDQYN